MIDSKVWHRGSDAVLIRRSSQSLHLTHSDSLTTLTGEPWICKHVTSPITLPNGTVRFCNYVVLTCINLKITASACSHLPQLQ